MLLSVWLVGMLHFSCVANFIFFTSFCFLQVGQALHLEFLTDVMSHCLSSFARTKCDGKSGRGPLEKSALLMLFFMEALCPHLGTKLEIGGGTGSVMRSAMHNARLCMVIERDEEICAGHLTPFVDNYYKFSTHADLGGFGDIFGDDKGSLAFTGVSLD